MESVTCVENSTPNQRYPIAIYNFLKLGGYEYCGKYVCSVPPYLKSSVYFVLFAAACRPNTNEYLKYTIVLYVMYI